MKPACACAAIVLVLTAPITAHARTWLVNAVGTGDAPTIQAGIDSAASGDTVSVAEGTYTGTGNKDLDFGGKVLVLRSEVGSETTIIDCEGAGRGLYFHSGEEPDARVEGLTVTNGDGGGGSGGGMYCAGSSPTLIDCVFLENSTSEDGGGMCCSGSSPTLVGCDFVGNSSEQRGGGVYCSDSSPTLDTCTFFDNSSMWDGGGIVCYTGSSPTLTDCAFSDNLTLRGGGMFCYGSSSPVLECCVFSGNEASWFGGGLACRSLCSPDLISCTFSDNSCTERGGGIHCADQCSLSLAGCTLAHNSGGIEGGGGIHCRESSDLVLDNTIIAFSLEGEAVYCDSSSAIAFTCCDLYGNAGGDWIGGIASQEGVNGNISGDPLFCDAGGRDYTLNDLSPCAAEHSGGCGLIGAWPVGCRSVPINPLGLAVLLIGFAVLALRRIGC